MKGDRRYGSLTAEPPERAGPQDAGDDPVVIFDALPSSYRAQFSDQRRVTVVTWSMTGARQVLLLQAP